MQYLLNHENKCLYIATIWPSLLYFELHLSYCPTARRKSQMGEKRGSGVVWGHVNISVHQGAAVSWSNQWQLIIHHINFTSKFIISVPWSFFWLVPTYLTSLLKIEVPFYKTLLTSYHNTLCHNTRPQQEYQLSCFSLLVILEVLTAVLKKRLKSLYGAFQYLAAWVYCILTPTSSRIHLQRRHASYRCARPLPAKAGTIPPNFASRSVIYKNPLGSFTCSKAGT
jgi:hypothetical protein